MFQRAEGIIPRKLALTNSISEMEIEALPIQYFDKDGYELTDLEVRLHEQNHVVVKSYLNHRSAGCDWFLKSPQFKYAKIDHSMISYRYHYEGEALYSLIKAKQSRPGLQKLINIRPKWGLDLSVDYITDDLCFDLFHVEIDEYDFDRFMETKCRIEEIVLRTDFDDLGKTFIKQKDQWQHLSSDDQCDWRARYLGLERAFDNKKVHVI